MDGRAEQNRFLRRSPVILKKPFCQGLNPFFKMPLIACILNRNTAKPVFPPAQQENSAPPRNIICANQASYYLLCCKLRRDVFFSPQCAISEGYQAA